MCESYWRVQINIWSAFSIEAFLNKLKSGLVFKSRKALTDDVSIEIQTLQGSIGHLFFYFFECHLVGGALGPSRIVKPALPAVPVQTFAFVIIAHWCYEIFGSDATVQNTHN